MITRHAATRRGATLAGLLVLVVAARLYASRTPDVLRADTEPGLFSAERAMIHVREIARGPHPLGGGDHRRVRDYILAQLATLGLPAQVQEATGVGTRYAVAGRVWNVVARRPGRRPGGPSVLLMAHYDGVPSSPAAGDDASGSAVLLETLRALRSDTLEHDVIALFTDGEEAGLLGAAAFVREHPWARDVAITLNFEARGTGGPSLMFETGPGNLDVVRVLRGVGGARATSLSTTVYRALPNDTDLSEIMPLGHPAMNFAFIGGAQRYHTAEDDAVHLDVRSVQHHGNQAVALTRALARGPLPRPRTGDAVFFDLPLVGIVAYGERGAPWLAAISLVLAVAATWRAKGTTQWMGTMGSLGVERSQERESEGRFAVGVLIGFVSVGAAAIVAALLGFMVAVALQAIHRGIGSGAPEWSGVYASTVVLLAIAVMAAIHAIAGRREGMLAARSGAVLAWSVLALIASLAAPGLSFLFVWPALFFGAALYLMALRPERPGSHVALWVATAVAVFLLVPTIYLAVCVAIGLNPMGAAILALFAALGASLLGSHFAVIAGERRARAVGVLVIVAAALFCVGVLTVRSGPESPARGALVYGVDADSGMAWLAGVAWDPAAREWLDDVLRPTNGGEAALPAWLRRNASSRYALRAPVPIPPIAPAVANVLSDSSVGETRIVTLRITPGRGTRAISMRAERGTVAAAQVDGRAIETSGYRGRGSSAGRAWSLHYHAPPETGFMLALTFRVGEALPPLLGFVSRHPGIPPLPGVRLPERPAGIIAAQDGDGTLVYQRIQIPSPTAR